MWKIWGQPNPIDPNPFLTRLKWLILTHNPFDPQPNWPDPIRSFCHV